MWAVERRENLLEDQSMFDRAKAGKATPQQVFDYYLGWIKNSSITSHVQLIPDSEVGYARQWGMNVEIEDLRRVVLRAQKLGGKVVVGGHSLGGSITTAYATWDFGGKPGARGLVRARVHRRRQQPDADHRGRRAAAPHATSATARPWLTVRRHPGAVHRASSTRAASLSVLLDPNSPSLGQASRPAAGEHRAARSR